MDDVRIAAPFAAPDIGPQGEATGESLPVQSSSYNIEWPVVRHGAVRRSGRAGVVGGAGGFVRGEGIEAGTGTGGSSNRVGQGRGASLRREAGGEERQRASASR